MRGGRWEVGGGRWEGGGGRWEEEVWDRRLLDEEELFSWRLLSEEASRDGIPGLMRTLIAGGGEWLSTNASEERASNRQLEWHA